MITIKKELKPFQTPNYVFEKELPRPREEGFQQSSSYKISELDPEVLSKLCDQFRKDIFKKAGKADPKLK